MLYTVRFFSSKCSLFHNANLFGSCIIHILYTGCAKIKKNYSGAKGLMILPLAVAWSQSVNELQTPQEYNVVEATFRSTCI